MRIRRQRSLPGETCGGGGVSECPEDFCPHGVDPGGPCPGRPSVRAVARAGCPPPRLPVAAGLQDRRAHGNRPGDPQPTAVRDRGRGETRRSRLAHGAAGRRRRMARPGLGRHVAANADDRTAVLARAIGDRTPHRPVRRPGGPPGARETRRAHGHPGRADLEALSRTDGADRRPCQRPVRGLRAWPDPYRAGHGQDLRRRWRRPARQKHPAEACRSEVSIHASLAPARTLASASPGLRAGRAVRDDGVLAMRLAITAGTRRADGLYPP